MAIRRPRFSFLTIFIALEVFLASHSVRGQTADFNDVNIGLRTENNVLDVQTEATASSIKSAGIESEIQGEQIKALGYQNTLDDLNAKKQLGILSIRDRETIKAQQFVAQSGLNNANALISSLQKALRQAVVDLPKGKEFDDPVYKFLLRYNFTDNTSYIGKGVLDTYQTDCGVDILFPTGTEFTPYFSYGHGRDVTGSSSLNSNLFAGTLSISQKLWPLIPKHPQAFQPFADKVVDLNTAYPGFDVKLGTDLTYGNTDKFTYKAGNGSNLNQDQYNIIPNITLDLYLSPRLSVSLIHSYGCVLSSTSTGGTGSSGLLQFQDRNSYLIPLTPNNSLQVFEFNTLERDINQEPLPPAGSISYQTWAKFGAGMIYTCGPHVSFTAQYSYEAFNKNYEAQYVTAAFNYKF